MSMLGDLDLRQELAQVRAVYERALAAGQGRDVLEEVAARDPVALVELVLGPKAPEGVEAVRAALSQAEVLETAMSVKALYGRLAELAGQRDRHEVVRAAARAYPVASWVVELAVRSAREHGGLVVLEELRARPQLPAACQIQAREGLVDTLIAFAELTGEPAPALALLQEGQLDGFAKAAVRAAEAAGLDAVLPSVVAAWGPDVEALLLRLVVHVRKPELARALADQARPWSPHRAVLHGIAAGVASRG